MNKNRLIKKENGSIAVYAIATVLSFIFILGGIFFTSAVIRKNQLRTMIKIKEIYAQDIGKADEIGNKVAEEIKKNEEDINIEPAEFQYTGAVQEWTVPATGKYKLEVWGAQGSDASPKVGGKGGFSKGNIYLEKDTILYFYIGSSGTSISNVANTEVKGGFNGGGSSLSTTQWTVGSGGGATDIRIGEDSLYARVIVAGGGGAANFRDNDKLYGGSGGAGGGISGNTGYDYVNSQYPGGNGGTQISGGAGSTNPSSGYMTNGNFGEGATYITSKYVLGGGGGGWYGGGSGYCSGSGGGSGWVYTAENFNTWKTGNPTDAANWKLNESYYLTDAQTIDGASQMPTYDGTSTMIGNSGNGYAKITWAGK